MKRKALLLRMMADEPSAGLGSSSGEGIRMTAMDIHRPRTLLMLFAAAVLAAGLLALVGAKPAWAVEPSFTPAQHFPVGTNPTTVTNADFNGDGKMDLAAQNSGSNDVSVLLRAGNGTFSPKSDYPVGVSPTAVIGEQFNDDNADGKVDAADFVDLAVANQRSGNVSVLLGKGDGTFRDKTDFPVPPASGDCCSDPVSLVSSDFNGDGKADLAVANSGFAFVRIMLGNGDGSFQAGGSFNISSDSNQIISSDFNGDGKADLAVTDLGIEVFRFRGGATVYLGNGDGTFGFGSRPLRLFFAFSVASGDFNGDGKADLAATGISSDRVVSVALGNGDGTFQGQQNFAVGDTPSAVTSADLDGDSIDDLAVSNYGSNNVSVLASNGDGTFQARRDFAVGTGPIFVIGAKLNTDNLPDIAVANQDSHNVSVLLNTTPPPAPDPVAPSSTHALSPLPNAAGWNNSNVTVTLSAQDNQGGSGVRAITYSINGGANQTYNPTDKILVSSEGTTTITYFATDRAGNAEEPKTVTVKLDKTAPQITPADVVSNVWRNSPLSQQFTASDATSDLANAADASFTLTASAQSMSANQPTVASRTVSDAAGNSTTRRVSALIDLSDPQVTASLSSQPNTNGWHNENVTLTLSAADNPSGVGEISYSRNGGALTTVRQSSVEIPITTEGETTISYSARDNAGNLAREGTIAVKLDKSAPTLDTDNSDGTDSITPDNRQTGVGRAIEPSATFSDEMDEPSLRTSAKLYQWNAKKKKWQPVPVEVSVVGKTTTLDPYPTDPSRSLAANKKFKVTITTGAKNLAGLSMSSPRSWTFTTGS